MTNKNIFNTSDHRAATCINQSDVYEMKAFVFLFFYNLHMFISSISMNQIFKE